MARFGFCSGGTYQSQSPNVSADRCVNFYPENIESGQGKSATALYPTPGLALFSTLTGNSVRGLISINGRCFAVAGTNFYEVLSDGTKTFYGAVLNDGLMVSMAASQTQVLIASGGTAYVFNLPTNTLQTLAPGVLSGVALVAFSDGFFLALLKNSAKVQISTLLDATSWPALQIVQVSLYPDNTVSMIVDHREMWLFGPKATVVYYDSGGINIFDPVPGGFIEQGIIAQFSPVKLDNSIFWLGGDERGSGIVWRAQGYTPARVSNHAVEFALQGYSKISDAIGYSYQDQGHSFYVLYFPTANKTWVFDAATGMWAERSFQNPATGLPDAHRSQCHCFVFGKHLVGDWATGSIYNMAISLYNDFGNPIRRVRRAPHISNEAEWIFHQQLQVDMETGLGPQPPLLDGQGNPRDPQIMLRWSDDGGHSWSNEYPAGAGQAGKFRTRVIWRRLGRSRDRVYEIAVSDGIPWRIMDAYLLATPGFQPTERLSRQFAKVS